ncbi:MAG: tRNA uridine(34) 5-carboxymethylaminomethyl modification radical SAM/GNAT enzyme Elp3 [Patescibacteria group bacterium]|nr:MAG: tRNA uridine(34) 5-carboxymethylaminomethyl modification radical SAM/GNAT enzyme Elp3 [Patescibacteria group bacterium]
MYYPPNYPVEEKEQLIKLTEQIIKNQDSITSREKLRKKINRIIEQIGYKRQPKLWMIYFTYLRFLSKKQISEKLLDLLRVVKIRSLSGIVPLSVFTKPEDSCPYNCVYCPIAENAPKSYFPDEAAVRRAIRHNYDPFEQTFGRLLQFYLSGHNINKVDVIIQGGTFSFYPLDYRKEFVKRIFDACNCDYEQLIKTGSFKKFYKKAKDLNSAKQINETAKSRIVGITIETRPDFINEQEIIFLRKLGVTRVELGVQTTDENILRLIKRGHTVNDLYKATYLLKEAGFKVTYHLMPGLPGSTVEKDIAMLKEVFTDERLKPDSIKFYPTQVVYNSQLLNWYQNKLYKPITEQELTKIVLEFKKNIVPEWLRIQRLVRDLTKNDIAVATFPANYRQNLHQELKKQNIHCPCIRCREIRNHKIKPPIKLKTIKYKSANGLEYFIEDCDSNNRVLGFLRLRIPEHQINKNSFFIKPISESALIRELHIYGKAVSFNEKGKTQHRGLGTKLILQAIKIAKKHNCQKISVISGVGVRNYYRKFGFRLEHNTDYMFLNLS